MNYAEQANLAMKVKRVCESVNDKAQVETMKRYVNQALFFITDVILMDECITCKRRVSEAYFPPLRQHATEQLQDMANQQHAMLSAFMPSPRTNAFAGLQSAPYGTFSGFGLSGQHNKLY